MSEVIPPSRFQNSATKCAREADEQDKLVHIKLGGGALIPIARAKRLARYYLKQDQRYVGPGGFQIAVIQTHYHRIVREDLAIRRILFVCRHNEVVGAWISDLAIGDLRTIDGDWLRKFD